MSTLMPTDAALRRARELMRGRPEVSSREVAAFLDTTWAEKEREIKTLTHVDGLLNKAGREQFDRAKRAEAALAQKRKDSIAQAKEIEDRLHAPASCGHARANWKDPKFGTPEYRGEEQCEVCVLVAEKEREPIAYSCAACSLVTAEAECPQCGNGTLREHRRADLGKLAKLEIRAEQAEAALTLARAELERIVRASALLTTMETPLVQCENGFKCCGVTHETEPFCIACVAQRALSGSTAGVKG